MLALVVVRGLAGRTSRKHGPQYTAEARYKWLGKQGAMPPVTIHNVSLDDGRAAYHGLTLVWTYDSSEAPGRASAANKNTPTYRLSLRSHPGPISWRLRAPLQTTVEETVKRYLAGASQSQDADAQAAKILANELRATAVAFLEQRDIVETGRRAQARTDAALSPSISVAKLAFELDEAAAASRAFAPANIPLPAPRTGIFIIWGDANPGLQTLFANAIKGAAAGTGRDAMLSARLHVLMHKKMKIFGTDAGSWHEALGADRAQLLGGVHLCRDYNPLRSGQDRIVLVDPVHISQSSSSLRPAPAPSPPTHEWLENEGNNYMHKAFAMSTISRMVGYQYILSMDDDIMVPPRSLDAMLRHAHYAVECSTNECEKRPGSCGVVLPALSNGIPTTEQFERLLPLVAQKRLSDCYAGSAIRHGESDPELALKGVRIDPW